MIRINLLPVRAARKRENVRRQVSVFFLSVVFLVIVMGYMAIGLGNEISELNARIEKSEAELRRLDKINKKVNEIKRKLDTLKAKRNVIKQLEANRSGPVQILDELTRLVVAEKMWLENLSEDGGRMRLVGVAVDNKTIADFMKRLEGSPYFDMVDLVSSKQMSLGQIAADAKKFKGFTITCMTLRPVVAKEG